MASVEDFEREERRGKSEESISKEERGEGERILT